MQPAVPSGATTGRVSRRAGAPCCLHVATGALRCRGPDRRVHDRPTSADSGRPSTVARACAMPIVLASPLAMRHDMRRMFSRKLRNFLRKSFGITCVESFWSSRKYPPPRQGHGDEENRWSPASSWSDLRPQKRRDLDGHHAVRQLSARRPALADGGAGCGEEHEQGSRVLALDVPGDVLLPLRREVAVRAGERLGRRVHQQVGLQVLGLCRRCEHRGGTCFRRARTNN